MAAILASVLRNKVDEDTPGIEPVFRCANHVKIRCHLGGVARHTDKHTRDSKVYPDLPHPMERLRGCHTSVQAVRERKEIASLFQQISTYLLKISSLC